MPRRPPTRRDPPPLVDEVRRALADGTIGRGDLERLLAESRPAGERPRATRVLEGLGLVVVLLGIVLAYATAFGDMPDLAQLLTPFAFPAVAFAVLAALARRGRPSWELEIASTVALGALAGATAASWAGAEGVESDVWGAGAALVVGVAAGLLLRRRPRLFSAVVALALAAIALAEFLGSVAGLEADGLRWLQLALAVAAVAVGLLLLPGDRDAAGLALALAVVLVVVACLIALAGRDADGLSVWHVVLSLAVAAATVMAATLRLPALTPAAVLTGIMWLMFVIPVAGGSVGWALVVVAMGLGLVGVGVAATRLQRRGGPR